jgi:hypothetical protein
MAQIRRPWTWEEVEKLLNMAQKYPTAQIASEIGRPIPSVRTKAQELFGTSDRTCLGLTTRNSAPLHPELRHGAPHPYGARVAMICLARGRSTCVLPNGRTT